MLNRISAPGASPSFGKIIIFSDMGRNQKLLKKAAEFNKNPEFSCEVIHNLYGFITTLRIQAVKHAETPIAVLQAVNKEASVVKKFRDEGFFVLDNLCKQKENIFKNTSF